MDVKRVALVMAVVAAGCAPGRPPSAIPDRALPASDGRTYPLVDRAAKLTVLELFSAHCPCQAEHDARFRALVETYRPQGVTFLAVDSEVGASVARDRAEAEKRGYAHPILVDAGGAVARALHAEYATYTVVVDAAGRVVYVGGIDSDKNHLTSDATPYLHDALDDALAGRPLRRADAKTLGCALTLE